eukprot:EG_transcript_29125
MDSTPAIMPAQVPTGPVVTGSDAGMGLPGQAVPQTTGVAEVLVLLPANKLDIHSKFSCRCSAKAKHHWHCPWPQCPWAFEKISHAKAHITSGCLQGALF